MFATKTKVRLSSVAPFNARNGKDAMGSMSIPFKGKSVLKRHAVKDKTSEEVLRPPEIRLSQIGGTAKTAAELDLEIQSQRIMHVLESTIRKLSIIASLKHAIQNNGEVLRKFLPHQEVEFILEVCATYTIVNPTRGQGQNKATSAMATMLEKISMFNFGKGDPKQEKKERKHTLFGDIGRKEEKQRAEAPSVASLFATQKFDVHMAQALELMFSNRDLLTYLERYENEKPEQAQDNMEPLIEAMDELKQIVTEKLKVSANEEKKQEKELRIAYRENAQTQESIERLIQQLQKQGDELGRQYKAKESIVLSYQAKIEDLQAKFKEDVQTKIIESEKSMIEDTEASEIRQKSLSDEADYVKKQYQQLLDDHLATEKSLRTKRFKIETQLSSWLSKYDADIGERQAEFEEITQHYEEEKAEMEALQQKFDEQEDEYDELMAERDAIEEAIYNEKAYKFLMNRSARRIQRFWRAYRERKLARKRARKGKAKQKSGGKKAKSAKTQPAKEVVTKQVDPNAALQKQFKGDILQEFTKDDAFGKSVDMDNTKGVTDVKTEERK